MIKLMETKLFIVFCHLEHFKLLFFYLVDSHFRYCLDEPMMKKHKLIVPSDLFVKVRNLVDAPSSK